MCAKLSAQLWCHSYGRNTNTKYKYKYKYKIQVKDTNTNTQNIIDVCKIVCTALVSQLWGHNNKVAHSIQHKPPLGQPTLQNTHKINNSPKTGPNMQN